MKGAYDTFTGSQTVVVTSYFPVFSHESDFNKVLEYHWLFNVHIDSVTKKLVPEDDVIGERRRQCVLCHLGNPVKIGECDIASAGHPNIPGAVKFAETILAALT